MSREESEKQTSQTLTLSYLLPTGKRSGILAAVGVTLVLVGMNLVGTAHINLALPLFFAGIAVAATGILDEITEDSDSDE